MPNKREQFNPQLLVISAIAIFIGLALIFLALPLINSLGTPAKDTNAVDSNTKATNSIVQTSDINNLTNPSCVGGQKKCVDGNYFTCRGGQWVNKGIVGEKCIQTESNADSFEFVKESYGKNTDCITSKVCITRGGTQGPYNSVLESNYSSLSPKGTEWYFGKYCDNNLSFKPWADAAKHNPQSTLLIPACLHLIEDNLYYDIMVTSWGGGNSGGAFAYIRTKANFQ